MTFASSNLQSLARFIQIGSQIDSYTSRLPLRTVWLLSYVINGLAWRSNTSTLRMVLQHVFYPFLNPMMSFIIISNLDYRTMHPLKDDIMYIKIADLKSLPHEPKT